MSGNAWVTLATNDSYSLGALVLAHSLKQAGTKYHLAVLVTPGVTNSMRQKLAGVFDLVEEVNVLDSKDEANLRLLKRPELGITFTKLHCWRLTQFEKCVFLDADTLVLKNADELFERDEFSAAPDVGWPDCFNSGVFVFKPSMETHEKLISFALQKGSFDGGDQGLLNLYFSDWSTKDISKHLPFIYNMCSTASYSYLPAFKQFGSDAKIVHFIGNMKPWLQFFNTETKDVQPSQDLKHLKDVLQVWWNIFCTLVHSNLSTDMSPETRIESFFIDDLEVKQPSDYRDVSDPWEEVYATENQTFDYHNTNSQVECTEYAPVTYTSLIHPTAISSSSLSALSNDNNDPINVPINNDVTETELMSTNDECTCSIRHEQSNNYEPDPVLSIPNPPSLPSGEDFVNKSCTDADQESLEQDGGLAGAFAQFSLGAPRPQGQSEQEDHLRRQAWEVGNIDYMGRDSFRNIWSKISETVSGTVSETPAAVVPEATQSEAVQPAPEAPAVEKSEGKPKEGQAATPVPGVDQTAVIADSKAETKPVDTIQKLEKPAEAPTPVPDKVEAVKAAEEVKVVEGIKSELKSTEVPVVSEEAKVHEKSKEQVASEVIPVTPTTKPEETAQVAVEKSTETKTDDKKGETPKVEPKVSDSAKPAEKVDGKPAEVKAEGKPEEVKAEKKPEEVKAEGKPEEVKAKGKPEELKASTQTCEMKQPEKSPEVKQEEMPSDAKKEEKSGEIKEEKPEVNPEIPVDTKQGEKPTEEKLEKSAETKPEEPIEVKSEEKSTEAKLEKPTEVKQEKIIDAKPEEKPAEVKQEIPTEAKPEKPAEAKKEKTNEVKTEEKSTETKQEKPTQSKPEQKPTDVIQEKPTEPKELPVELKPEEKSAEVKQEKPTEQKTEKPIEAKPEEKPSEDKKDEAKQELKSKENLQDKAQEKSTETKNTSEEKPVETQKQDKPGETKPEEKPTEVKKDEKLAEVKPVETKEPTEGKAAEAKKKEKAVEAKVQQPVAPPKADEKSTEVKAESKPEFVPEGNSDGDKKLAESKKSPAPEAVKTKEEQKPAASSKQIPKQEEKPADVPKEAVKTECQEVAEPKPEAKSTPEVCAKESTEKEKDTSAETKKCQEAKQECPKTEECCAKPEATKPAGETKCSSPEGQCTPKTEEAKTPTQEEPSKKSAEAASDVKVESATPSGDKKSGESKKDCPKEQPKGESPDLQVVPGTPEIIGATPPTSPLAEAQDSEGLKVDTAVPETPPPATSSGAGPTPPPRKTCGKKSKGKK